MGAHSANRYTAARSRPNRLVFGPWGRRQRRYIAQAKIDFSFYKERLDFQYLTGLPLQDLLTELSHLPPQTLVFYTTLFRDGAGATLVPREAVERVSAAANAPTYGFLDQYVGRGIVGGNVSSLSAHGVEMAKLALRVLAGTEASAPQVSEVATNKLLFDWRQLQRWGISESKLPAGSEIWFRESSAWEQYKPQILAITAAILAQALLIACCMNVNTAAQTDTTGTDVCFTPQERTSAAI